MFDLNVVIRRIHENSIIAKIFMNMWNRRVELL